MSDLCRVIRNHRSGRCISMAITVLCMVLCFRPTFLSLVFSSTRSNSPASPPRAGRGGNRSRFKTLRGKYYNNTLHLYKLQCYPSPPWAPGSALSALTPPSRNVASRDPRLGTPHTHSCPTTRERTRDHRTSHARVATRSLPSHRPATSE